jgi:hypothetical protein
MPATIRKTLDLGQRPDRGLIYAALPMGLGVSALPLLQGDEQVALGLLLLTPALLIGAYVVTRAILGDRLGGTIIAVTCIFIIAAYFRSRAYDDKSIDWQVGLKMVALAVLLGMAVVFLAYAFGRLRLGRLFYEWLLFFAWLVVASLYSESIVFALGSSISFLVVYFFAVYMTVWLSRTRALEILMFVGLLLCVGSIFVYFAFPSMGRVGAWVADVDTGSMRMRPAEAGEIGRMKGLVGQPNTIGVIAALAIMYSLLYYRALGKVGRRLAILLMPSALACLVLSNSRTSMVAMAIALWFAFVCRSGTAFKLILSITVALVCGAFLMGFADEIFSVLSRSGRVDEITSATGRSIVWAVVIDLWSQRPVFGYGYTSSLAILPSYPGLFTAAVNTHNMFLELLFAGGIGLLGMFIYVTYRTFLEICRLQAINEGALFVFVLTRGLAEASPFGGVAGYLNVAFATVIALVISKAIDARVREPATRPLTETLRQGFEHRIFARLGREKFQPS